MSMKKHLIFLIAMLSIPFSLHADIIVTNDGMILNGKILERKPAQILFGNYHGTFTIDRSQIKEIRETGSFQEDVLIYQEMGKAVDESEVKINYQAGVEKLEDTKADKADEAIPPASEYVSLLITPFYTSNTGKLGSVMPYSAGATIIGDFPLRRMRYIESTGITGIRSEAGYIYSKKGVKTVQGPRISAGPLWEFPFVFKGVRGSYAISPIAGIGWYTIEGRTEKTAALKWNAGVITGPVFYFKNAVFFPQVRFDYIHDGSVPLYGFGIGLGAGVRFGM